MPDKYYHIFNRGANGKVIFYTPANYNYFLKLIDKFLLPYCTIISYCLLPNHFHLLIRTHESHWDISEYRKMITRQFKGLFVTYAMAINKQEHLIGNLFDPKYKRLEITDDDYLKYLIFYIHYNPEKHGYVKDFTEYQFSSFQAVLSHSETKVDRNLSVELFGDIDNFKNYHRVMHEEK